MLVHRGPDGYGVHHHRASDCSLAFGAGRLAIIDLSAPAGPLFNEDGGVGVVFNGEIYNHKALRANLERAGHIFKTKTDTEVIVHGYEEWGVDVIDRLRGMFAIGVWDAPRRRLLLARDRLGEKPLYFAHMGDQFLFASEIKGMLAHAAVRRRVNPDALPLYLTLGYTPAGHTMFDGIHKLGAGELMILDREASHTRRYWQPVMDTQPAPRDGALSYAEAVRQVRTAVFEAVETRLMSDVPLGAFLSGGVDSTAVVAIMARLSNQPVCTFTVGFDDSRAKFNVDDRFATLAAEHLKTDHRRVTLPQDERLAHLLPHLIYALDEPVAQPSIIQTVHVAALARHSGVPVLLSGDAGDELFAGYNSYRLDRVLEGYLRVPSLLRTKLLTPLLESAPARFDAMRKLAAKSRLTDPVSRYLSWVKLIEVERQPGLLAAPHRRLGETAHARLAEILRPLLEAPKTRYFADRIAFASLNTWIPEDSNMRVDKMCMAMSIEARAPLEDHPLVALAHRLPLDYKLRLGDFKAVFKDAVRDLVPASILARPKWGFFPPVSNWLRTVFRPLVNKYLAPDYVAACGWFDPGAVTAIVRAHLDEGKYELWPLWTLLVFHLWHALYIDGSLTLGHKISPHDLVTNQVK